MTKPGFVLKRIKQLFQSDDINNQKKVYEDFISKRNKQKEKMCYCDHTTDCDCGNPSFEEFKHNLLNNNIKEKDLL